MHNVLALVLNANEKKNDGDNEEVEEAEEEDEEKSRTTRRRRRKRRQVKGFYYFPPRDRTKNLRDNNILMTEKPAHRNQFEVVVKPLRSDISSFNASAG